MNSTFQTEAQIDEKRIRDAKSNVPVQETWADKLGQSHRTMQLPEQPKVPFL